LATAFFGHAANRGAINQFDRNVFTSIYLLLTVIAGQRRTSIHGRERRRRDISIFGSGAAVARKSRASLRLYPAERQAVHRLRYDAYVRRRLIEPRADGQLYDEEYDDASNAWITMTFIDGELASTLRVNVAVDENGALPSLSVFSDVIMPHLRMGRVVIDLTRLAARLEVAQKIPELPYVALRPAWMAAEYFKADRAVANVLRPHLAFYRLTFGYAAWSEPRDYPYANCKTSCMGVDFRAVRERVEARYPFFRSTSAVRKALFSRQAGQHIRRPDFPERRPRVSSTT
jgi:hypothetical protein